MRRGDRAGGSLPESLWKEGRKLNLKRSDTDPHVEQGGRIADSEPRQMADCWSRHQDLVIRLIGIVYSLSSINIKLLKEAVAKCSCRLAITYGVRIGGQWYCMHGLKCVA